MQNKPNLPRNPELKDKHELAASLEKNFGML
jgi:hypothetical protein